MFVPARQEDLKNMLQKIGKYKVLENNRLLGGGAAGPGADVGDKRPASNAANGAAGGGAGAGAGHPHKKQKKQYKDDKDEELKFNLTQGFMSLKDGEWDIEEYEFGSKSNFNLDEDDWNEVFLLKGWPNPNNDVIKDFSVRTNLQNTTKEHSTVQ